ncbi:MAG TPA: NnrU family protein [Candidatus Sulfotelmatobacter sp.]|jgi:uncharacterized membrane protein|nr:NnrU family protein [Candidatus Sulfotelmatobacter sp.]
MPETESFLSLYAALGAFFATHSLPSLPGVRGRLVALLGEKGYLIVHSLLATLTLVWLVAATLAAPRLVLWGFHDWARWVPLLTMPFACMLLVAGLTSANPFSLGAGRQGFNPARPGIVALTRHPVLWAAALWSGSHLFPNGELRAVLLFGALCGFSLMGMALFDRRRRELQSLRVRIRFSPSDLPGLLLRALGGLLLYGALLHLHEPVFGFNPLTILGS